MFYLINMVFRSKKHFIDKVIDSDDVVLDIGFWGQAVKRNSVNWPHKLLIDNAKEVYGVDLDYEKGQVKNPERYQKASADNFDFDKEFDVIFSSELIEHLSNPGLFLEKCSKHLKKDGKLILTTPNAFSFFNLFQKIFKKEPPVNTDHTMYFNRIVLEKLLVKNNFQVESFGYIDTFRGWGVKRNVMRFIDILIRLITPKFTETIFVVAKKNEEN